jgi:nitroimidazol reductase NimA-like FMN-containing flavoprotein (pyridoxamine 5'-phosphate oxidase superfamily)
MMRQNPHVCFEVEHVERWYNWRTVIAWGMFEELAGEEADHAYHLIHSRLTPLIEFEADPAQGASQPALGNRNDFVLYRIRLEEISGRFERL